MAALIVVGVPVAADVTPPDPVPATASADADAADEPGTETPPPPANDDNTIVVSSGPYVAPPGDPLAKLNAQTYDATQKVDEALVAPVAKGYEDAVPGPVRSGLRNFFRNLKSPVIFLNYMLQFKPGKAFETVGRFAVNSTVGVAGLIDVAKEKPFNLPFRDNGFADTLGYYGVGPGPFFFLPLLGPTTLRDMFGGAVDGLVLPTLVGKPFNTLEYTIPTGVIRSLDYRIEFDAELARQRATVDPYTASREYYLSRRKAEIDALHGIVVDAGAFETPVYLAPVVTDPAPVAVALPPAAPEPAPEPQFVSEPVVQPLP